MYYIEVSAKADKFLEKLDKHTKQILEKKLKKLEDNPYPQDTKFLGRDEKNEKMYRYRLGDYRALYNVKEERKIVLIAKIDKRPRVYNK